MPQFFKPVDKAEVHCSKFSVDITVVFTGNTFYERTVNFTAKLTVAKLRGFQLNSL